MAFEGMTMGMILGGAMAYTRCRSCCAAVAGSGTA